MQKKQTSGHRACIDRLLSEVASLEAGNALLDRTMEKLSAILAAPAEEPLHCWVCGCDLSKSAIPWNDDERDDMCGGCHGEFQRKCAKVD